MKKYLISILSLLLSVSFVFAQDHTDPKSWKPEDLVKQESAGSFDISSCEKWITWVKRSPNKEKNRTIGKIFLTNVENNKEYQLTRGKVSDRSPKFAPSGGKIAFLSSREKGNQIWILNMFGGEPYKLTGLENGVNSFVWIDSAAIIFTARENKTYRENKLKKEKDDVIVVGDQEHYLPTRLFKINIKSKKTERLSENSGRINEFKVSPDNKWIVTNENQSVHYSYDNKIPPKQFLYNLKNKTRKEIFTEPNLNPRGFGWTRDSRAFYCSRSFASDPANDYVSISTLSYYDLEKQKLTDVNLDWEKRLGRGYYVTDNGILVTLANGATNKLAFYEKTGDFSWKRTWLDDDKMENIGISVMSKAGNRIVYNYSTASTPVKYETGKLSGNKIEEKKEFLKINGFFKKKNIAKSEVIHWAGANGDEVEGILYYPHNYKEGNKYPLVPVIHGGPSGVDMDRWRESWSNYPNLLAGKGAFVLKVNYHGSGNYGLKWIESIKKHYYELEVPDILNGVDFLINKGLVDPDKLGIMGWSNGSILAIQCCLERQDFKVLCAGAGDVNWTSDYGNCAFGAGFDNAYFGGPPWENPEYYIKISPLFQMEKNITPTIIFFGTNDTNVPTEQGWEHYRALQQIGKAPVRFLLFPGQPHGLGKLSYQLRKVKEEMIWFDKYLFNSDKPVNEAFKEGSPLAVALEKAKAAKSEDKFGITLKGKLVPETVKHDSLMVGRFEVTCAQYKAFKKSFKYDKGKENYPVTGISYDDALEYCKWLSKQSGKDFRLPEEKEMNKLAGKANKSKENNLDYWAGYSPIPEEVKLLKEKIKLLEKSGNLLMEAGSNPPAGKTGIFDLGGNAAEWCKTKDGKGKACGLSAVSATDKKTGYSAPENKYTGFRVCYKIK